MIYNVVPTWIKATTKRSALQDLLRSAGEATPAPGAQVGSAFEQELFAVATVYLIKGVNLAYLANVALSLKRANDSGYDRDAVQTSADSSLRMYWGGVVQIRNAVLHLLFPDDYEPIPAQSTKKRIVSQLGVGLALPSDTDAALRLIRRRY